MKGNATNHLRVQQRRAHLNARCIGDGRLTGVTDYGAFAEDELEVYRLFAVASSQFDHA